MKSVLKLGITLLIVALSSIHTFAEEVTISTIEELIEYAAKDNVNVTMKGGEYRIDNPKFAKRVVIQKFSATSSKEGQKGSDYSITTYLHFSGNNSRYNLAGVVVKLAEEMHATSKTGHIFEMFVSGDGNLIEGLSVEDEGDTPAYGSGAIMTHVMGDDNTLRGVNLFVKGSSPYGYGHLLGKGKPTGLVELHKHSSLLVSGRNTKLLYCKVITHAYGHGIVMQGAVNTYIEGCYVEGKMRPTDEMLKEREGVSFESDFKTIYPPGVIEPNRMIALSEDGIRTYPYGGYVGRRTEGLTVVNSTVRRMRSGIDASVHIAPTTIIGCTTIECQEKGYSIGSGGVITDCRGDAKYGPLLTFQRTDVKNCYVELELLPDESDYKVERLAEISGSGHYIKLTNFGSKVRTTPLPIVFGESFWGDVHIFRQPEEEKSKFVNARNVTLINETSMPTIFAENSSDCRLFTNGEVIGDSGKGNIVTSICDNPIEVINKGIGGNSSANMVERVYSDVVALRPDLTIMMVGTNDMVNSKKVTTYEKYRANLAELITTLKANGSQVMLMSSLPNDEIYLAQRHDTTKYLDRPKVVMAHISEIVEGLAREYGCYFVDLHGEFTARGLPDHNKDPYIRNMNNCNKNDGVHPTPKGYELMSEIVWNYFIDNNLTTKYKRIVCFGDSITRGSGSKPGGDYPSLLRKKIDEL